MKKPGWRRFRIDLIPGLVVSEANFRYRGLLLIRCLKWVSVRKGMKKETLTMMRELATYGSLGMSVAFSVFIGVFLGVLIDRWLETQPVGTLAGLGFGIAAAFRHILWMIRRMGRT